MDIAATFLIRKFKEKLEVCRDLLHGFDISKFKSGTDLERSNAISGALGFLVVAPEMQEKKNNSRKKLLLLHQALSLCSSIAKEDEKN